jgi:hypothetical protein
MLGRVEDWRGVPKVRPICLLPVSYGSASLAEYSAGGRGKAGRNLASSSHFVILGGSDKQWK